MTGNGKDELKEFSENPFDPEKVKPEDLVRLFYIHDVPVIPVVSRRGYLVGIIRKKDVISELSDIERSRQLKTDKFISKLAQKMNFEDLLPYGRIREFVVINIFGEVQGKWPRSKLFAACEMYNQLPEKMESPDAEKEEQILEWIIYLILEFIPRPLYAVNDGGGTIFYNSLFEDLFVQRFGRGDVDTKSVETSLGDPDKNDLLYPDGNDDIHFYNKDLGIHYEKIPMTSRGRKVGYLIFCDKMKAPQASKSAGGAKKGKTLTEMLYSFEREIISAAMMEHSDPGKAAASLGLTRKTIEAKAKKLGIKI